MSPKGDIADKPKADTMAGSGSYLDAFNKAPSPSSSPQSFASAPKKKMVNEPKSKVDTMAGSGSYRHVRIKGCRCPASDQMQRQRSLAQPVLCHDRKGASLGW